MNHNIEMWKKTVVFFGTVDNKRPIFNATGFITRISGVYHVITAKHVIMSKDNKPMDDICVFSNSIDGKIMCTSISNLKKRDHTEWLFHHNPNVDIAIMPIPLNLKEQDIKIIPEKYFLKCNKLSELVDIFFLSYQPSSYLPYNRDPIPQKISPIIRSGIISRIDEDKTFLIDGFSFPGNSGSPVFTKSILEKQEDNKPDKIQKLFGQFIGLIGGYLPYHEPAISPQTGDIRILFEENTGLSKVWSSDLIFEIMEYPGFKEQVAKCLECDKTRKIEQNQKNNVQSSS